MSPRSDSEITPFWNWQYSASMVIINLLIVFIKKKENLPTPIQVITMFQTVYFIANFLNGSIKLVIRAVLCVLYIQRFAHFATFYIYLIYSLPDFLYYLFQDQCLSNKDTDFHSYFPISGEGAITRGRVYL